MTVVEGLPRLEVGAEIKGLERTLTPERVVWYGDGLMTSASGVRTLVGSNIHTDEEYARGQGLTAAIADGMHSTNWVSAMLVRTFGRAYIETGELRTKYVKPTLVGSRVKVLGRIRDREELDDGSVRYELEVWVEDDDGTRLTDGDAAVVVPAS